MNIYLALRVITSVGLIGLILGGGHALAKNWDCSGSKKATKETISSQTIRPGDDPARELVQVERIDIISSKDPELDGIENTVYLHLDHLGATGDNMGYSVWHLNSGEKVWLKFHGTHYFVPKGNDDWEIPYLGVFRFIAGTGKYKAIRGGGHYKGVATPAGVNETLVCTAEY